MNLLPSGFGTYMSAWAMCHQAGLTFKTFCFDASVSQSVCLALKKIPFDIAYGAPEFILKGPPAIELIMTTDPFLLALRSGYDDCMTRTTISGP